MPGGAATNGLSRSGRPSRAAPRAGAGPGRAGPRVAAGCGWRRRNPLPDSGEETGHRTEGLLPGARDRLETAPSFLPSGRHAPLARTDPRLGGRRRVQPLIEGLRVAAAAGVSADAATAPNAAGARLENISGLGRSLTTASLLLDSVLCDWPRREHVTPEGT